MTLIEDQHDEEVHEGEQHVVYRDRRVIDGTTGFKMLPIINMITSFVTVIALAFCGYLITEIRNVRSEANETRKEIVALIQSTESIVESNSMDLAAIKSNRFTSNDAITLMNKLYDRLANIERELAEIPKEVPPQWFKDQVQHNTETIEQLRDIVVKLANK